MAENRRFALNHQLDIAQLLSEAQNRWFRPSEVCEILRNYQKFYLTPDPPYKPPGGSLFLFDRKALRYFRKDGHHWRKKKDGKTVREAHEKLKAGSVDVLHCYYAHGEDNENFQRRSYWMLDGQLEHIVLVHYREVKEGNRSAIPSLSTTDAGTQKHTTITQASSAAYSAQVHPPVLEVQASYASSSSTADWNGQAPSENDDVDSEDDFGASSLVEPVSCSRFQIATLHTNDTTIKNTLGCRGIMSFARGSTDAIKLNNGSCNPFYANDEVLPQNVILNKGYQTDYGPSQESDFSELSQKHLGSGFFSGASFNHDASCSTWSEILSSDRHTGSHEHKNSFNQPNGADVIIRKLTESTLDADSAIENGFDGRFRVFHDSHLQMSKGDVQNLVKEHRKEDNASHVDYFPNDNCIENDANHINQVPYEYSIHLMPQFQNNSGSCMNAATNDRPLIIKAEDCRILKNVPERGLCDDEQGGLRKLDSFGRWMNNEIGRDCDDALMASNSGNYWNMLDTQNDKEHSCLSCHMQLDVDSLSPSLSQDQLFSILDFSPDWAYSGVETKVLILGTFLGITRHPGSSKLCCMFGEVEVVAEILKTNVLRCHAPPHAPGRVPFYITCSDRLACSEVREFEYRDKPTRFTFSRNVKSQSDDEMHFQIRFAKMVSFGVDRKWLNCSIEKCDKCKLKNKILSIRGEDEIEWGKIKKSSMSLNGSFENPREALIQKLLKDRLYEWLVCKVHEEGKGPIVLDGAGQGIIHLAAALGYEWAMSPIVAAGVSPSFRDSHGRTGLHWAAYFGREETVVTLVRLGAASGAVEDPTRRFPGGLTAADLASSRGHKGIAGYLAEADLTSHLSSLTVKEETVVDSVSATLAAEKAIVTAQEQSIVPLDGGREEQLSLRESLAAVRNSALAAARIQAAFRVRSFHHRQLSNNCDKNSEISSQLIVSYLNKGQKIDHFRDYLHAAAIRIQQKYRGWKGRKEFLKIRDHIVKIQAHVRGHQVRKLYKKVVWSVSIVEKAILRWRRKGAGLRGFRADKAIVSVEPDIEKTDDYEFLRIGRKQKAASVEKALARVQSMARHPEGREQYMRLVGTSRNQRLDSMSATTEGPRKVDEYLLAPIAY